MFKRYARHQILKSDEVPFSADEYSKFKYGDYGVAEKFGIELSQGFLEDYGDLLFEQEEVLLFSSPYDHIPTASFYLTEVFERQVNQFLYKNGKKSLIQSKIHRNKTYSADYGNLTREERIDLIKNDTYHIDTSLMKNKLCLLIDDIRITGSHEYVIKKLIKDHDLQGDFVFIYFANLISEDIHPRFENYLNYHFVKEMEDVMHIIQHSNFKFNTRVIKFLLSSEKEVFSSFIIQNNFAFLKKMTNYAIGNNYHLMDEYRENLNHLIKFTNNGYKSKERAERSHHV